MSGIQHQIVDLNQKVDQLHEIVERLSGQITTLATHKQPTPPSFFPKENEPIEIEIIEPLIGSESVKDATCPGVMDHKDVLQDTGYGYKSYNSPYGDNYLAPETQIRRLTAQLTAAYNRIAVLEEQLLSRRVRS